MQHREAHDKARRNPRQRAAVDLVDRSWSALASFPRRAYAGNPSSTSDEVAVVVGQPQRVRVAQTRAERADAPARDAAVCITQRNSFR